MQIQKSKKETSTGAAVQVSIELKLGPGEYLLGVELIELDSTGNQFYDVGLIALAHPGGAGIDLKYGHIAVGGSLRWAGRLRPTEPIVLVGYFAFPSSGNTCEVRYMTGGPDEAPTPDGPTVVQTYPVGKARMIGAAGAAGVTAVPLRPDANRQWLVIEAQVSCNEDAKVCSWSLTDGTTTIAHTGSAMSTGVGLTISHNWLNSGNMNYPFAHPLMLTRDVYAIGNAAVTGAGVTSVKAFVLEFAGGT